MFASAETRLSWFRTISAIGFRNVLRVARYRLLLKAGMHKAQHLRPSPVLPGPFFDANAQSQESESHDVRNSMPRHFGWSPYDSLTCIPDWHASAISAQKIDDPSLAWWKIPDFKQDQGDIKAIWDYSRFDWTLYFAQSTKDSSESIEILNRWLADWSEKNPPYRGPNWKCGQEASIRVIRLAIVALILRQIDNRNPALITLIRNHCLRIEPTTEYAIAQDNNHGTSEGAALFIGGSWLESLGVGEGSSWSRLGRTILEDRVDRLIADDGSFSQYSTNYHRLLLDTLSVSEAWRRAIRAPAFSHRFLDKSARAAEWLDAMIAPETVDVPNIGANDSSQLLTLRGIESRDFQTSVDFATAVFRNEISCESNLIAPLLSCVGIKPSVKPSGRKSRLFDDGGFAVLRRGTTMAVVRYPRFRFRPSDADALHVDLWRNGKNLLRDAGTFSYADDRQRQKFSGVAGHNTVQFDDREQMPRLGRFLWGDWLTTSERSALEIKDDSVTFAARYHDRFGCSHNRSVSLRERQLIVQDAVSGFSQRAVLRWRLSPGQWRLSGRRASDGVNSITVGSDVPLVRLEINSGYESRFYLQKTLCPILEAEIRSSGSLTTHYEMGE